MDNILPNFRQPGVKECLSMEPSVNRSGDTLRRNKSNVAISKRPARSQNRRPKLLDVTSYKSAYDKTNPSPLLEGFRQQDNNTATKKPVPKVGEKSAGQIRHEKDILRYRQMTQSQALIDASHDTVVVNLLAQQEHILGANHSPAPESRANANANQEADVKLQDDTTLDFFTQSRTFCGQGSSFAGGRQPLKSQRLRDPGSLLVHEQVASGSWMVARSGRTESTEPRSISDPRVAQCSSFPGVVLALCPMPCVPTTMKHVFRRDASRSGVGLTSRLFGLKVYLSEQSHTIRIAKLHNIKSTSKCPVPKPTSSLTANANLETCQALEGGHQWNGSVRAGEWVCIQDTATHSQLVLRVGAHQADRAGVRTLIWNTSTTKPSISMTHKNGTSDVGGQQAGEDQETPGSGSSNFAFNLSITVVSSSPEGVAGLV
jgi:hypothetical protein